MKIAILSTPTAPLPPQGYAGIERVVNSLQQGLVKKGHDVTVFATGDSNIDATLAYYYKRALSPSVALTYNPYYFLNNVYHFFSLLEKEKFDIIHFNDAGRLSLYFARYITTPFVTTLHGSYEIPREDRYGITMEKRNQLLLFKEYPYVSISKAQQSPLPQLNYIGTVYNGITLTDFPFYPQGNSYIAWLGRVTPAKGLDSAIRAASMSKTSLKAYGFIDTSEKAYYADTIEPLLQKYPTTTFQGELTDSRQKAAFFGNAKAFIFPSQWEEPFGLVMLEAMATGTPVIAFARGAAREVVEDGVTGFIVNPTEQDIRGNFIIKKTGITGLAEAIQRIMTMTPDNYSSMRRACRRHVEKKFTVDKMVSSYETIYKKLIETE